MRRIRTALCVLGLAGVLAIPASMAGPAGQGYTIVYFDASGAIVGGQVANCGGQVSAWGLRTPFRNITYFYCD